MNFTEPWIIKKRRAINTLVRLGAVHYARSLDIMYHGRSGDGSPWKVEAVNNSGNNTGNHNVYNVAGLYTSSAEHAKAFAQERAREKKGIPEVHKIESIDSDAVVFNISFNPANLSGKDRYDFNQAMEVLSQLSVTNAKPIKFEYRDVLARLYTLRSRYQDKYSYVSKDAFERIIQELKKDNDVKQVFNRSESKLREFVLDYIQSYNTRIALKRDPAYVLRHYKSGLKVLQVNGSEYPISSEYIAAWCTHNHIVGTKDRINSATIDKEIDACHLFDTKKIMSQKQRGEQLYKFLNTYGQLSSDLNKGLDDNTRAFLISATSQEIMDCICQDPKLKALFDKDGGIWEKWTVGQHTQSVIDFFDRYYQDEIPDSLKPCLKISMIAHDLGKGIAVENSISQQEANLQVSSILYNALGISAELRQMINFIINDSQMYTTAVLKGSGTKSGITTACYQAYKRIFRKEPTQNEVEGLKNLCVMLQQCDSGAYTRYSAVKSGTGKIKYYIGGGNDNFTNSFVLDEQGKPRLKVFYNDRVL